VEPDGGDGGGVENGSGDSMGLDWGAAVSLTPIERETRPSDSISVSHNAHYSSYRPPLPSTHPVARAHAEKALRQAKKNAPAVPVSATRRAPITRKRKVQSSYNEERDSKKSKTDTAIGPDSTEMIAIKRMLIYLEQSSSDVALVRSFHNVVEDSENVTRRSPERHLPVRFERLSSKSVVTSLDPSKKAFRTLSTKN
jgi:hypothetical protein